jgi:hypothetical protein
VAVSANDSSIHLGNGAGDTVSADNTAPSTATRFPLAPAPPTV